MEKKSETLSIRSSSFFKSTERMQNRWVRDAMRWHHSSGPMSSNRLLTSLHTCSKVLMDKHLTMVTMLRLALACLPSLTRTQRAIQLLKTKDTTGKMFWPWSRNTSMMKLLLWSCSQMMICSWLDSSAKLVVRFHYLLTLYLAFEFDKIQDP